MTKCAVLQKFMFKLLEGEEKRIHEGLIIYTTGSRYYAYVHVTFMDVWCVLTELRLAVLGQASAACTMLGLQEKQDGKSAPAKYTKEVAGKKAIDTHTDEFKDDEKKTVLKHEIEFSCIFYAKNSYSTIVGCLSGQ